ncbi:MAG: hypothetical protein ACLFNO_04035 [Parcubacteria group bacterium]
MIEFWFLAGLKIKKGDFMLQCGNCGYKKGYSISEGEVNKEGKDFYELEGAFTMSKFGRPSSFSKVNLYICPECKTVIADNDYI